MEKAEKVVRKRRQQGDELDRQRKKLRAVDEEGEHVVEEEEEVEEFFAILRRMHEAVKYFEKARGGGRKLSGWTWRKALEAETVAEAEQTAGPGAVTDDETEKAAPSDQKPRREADELFDLNSAPEESNGD